LYPEALNLIECFAFEDWELKSAIGSMAGHPYETMLDWAKQNPLNAVAGELQQTLAQAKL
jgi:hypothetical protein